MTRPSRSPDVPGGKLRVLIVDDEPLARRRIRKLLQGREGVEILGECGSGEEALRALRRRAPDLVFLDVQMPGLDGFDVLARLDRGRVPLVIFVTAYDDYTLRAFDVHALDYLLKPFDDERFELALERGKQRLLDRRAASFHRDLQALLDDHVGSASHGDKAEAGDGRLPVKTGGRVLLLDPAEVDWVGAEGSYVGLHVGQRTHLLRETMNRLEQRLPEQFQRIHRSTIVNVHRVRELRRGRGGDCHVVLLDGSRLSVSEPRRAALQRSLGLA